MRLTRHRSVAVVASAAEPCRRMAAGLHQTVPVGRQASNCRSASSFCSGPSSFAPGCWPYFGIAGRPHNQPLLWTVMRRVQVCYTTTTAGASSCLPQIVVRYATVAQCLTSPKRLRLLPEIRDLQRAVLRAVQAVHDIEHSQRPDEAMTVHSAVCGGCRAGSRVKQRHPGGGSAKRRSGSPYGSLRARAIAWVSPGLNGVLVLRIGAQRSLCCSRVAAVRPSHNQPLLWTGPRRVGVCYTPTSSGASRWPATELSCGGSRTLR